MNFLIPVTAKNTFSDHAISNQLERIFLHPDFSKSMILKKFLSFIVHETLIGNSNWLKEYTIAVKVLEKPSNFNPQKNCIVRIHAGRLRTALSHYYDGPVIEDPIVIGVPKGKYVPVFMDRQQWLNEKKFTLHTLEQNTMRSSRESLIIAVLPFICTNCNETEKLFSDSLCLQICSALSLSDEVSVIAYHAVKNLALKYDDLKELGSLIGFNHAITGGIQYIKDQVRINIQIINCNSYMQIWSKIFECKVTTTNLFEIQDQICRFMTNQVRILYED